MWKKLYNWGTEKIANLVNHISGFFSSLSNAIKFFRLGWKDAPFDYCYILYLERYKLKQMSEYFSTSVATDDSIVARDTRICYKLLDIITDSDDVPFSQLSRSINKKDSVYVNIRNASRFLIKRRKVLRLNNDIDKYSKAFLDDLRKEKAWSLYCKIRKNKTFVWWN